MEGMFSMSQMLYNQVDQIADVKTCKINNVETKCYKVRWKCTWEPEIVLQKFCADVIDEYEQSNVYHNKNDLEELAKEKRKDFVATHIGEKLIDKYGISEAEHLMDEMEATCSSNDESLSFRDDLIRNNEEEDVIDVSNIENTSKKRKILNNPTLIPYVTTVPGSSRKNSNSDMFPEINIFSISELPNAAPKKSLNQIVKIEQNEEIIAKTNSDKNKNVDEGGSTISLPNSISQGNLIDQSEELMVVDTFPLETLGHVLTNTIDNAYKKYLIRNRHNKNLNRTVFECQVCFYSTPLKCNLDRHMRKHTGEKPYKCHLCSYSAVQKMQLKNHLVKHSGKKSFQCTECSYSTSINHNLKIHMHQHRKIKQFKCQSCFYSTSHPDNLKIHICEKSDTF